MLKKRLIFTLLFDRGSFVQSRNFKLQRVGDYNWLSQNYGFSNVSKYIDELLLINVNAGGESDLVFLDYLMRLSRECFIPITAGGGVRSLDQIRNLFLHGADKVVVNTALSENKQIVSDAASVFGRQSIVAAVDFKYSKNNFHPYIFNGTKQIECTLERYLKDVLSQPIGELYLNSIDRDGTGQGYFLEVLEELPTANSVPVIIAGGAGNQTHLELGLNSQLIDAVATANLFNFVGNGLKTARQYLLDEGANLVVWPPDSQTVMS